MSGRVGQSRRSASSWGWHPLRAEWADRVVAASPVRRGDLVLDLGAGTGALTRPLTAAGARVLAFELHQGRLATLRREFEPTATRVVEVDLRELRLPARPFRVVSSPPYALTSHLVRLLLSCDRLLSADLVLERRAVARLVARPPSTRQARRYVVERGMSVPRRAFDPAPAVDSAVLRIRRG